MEQTAPSTLNQRRDATVMAMIQQEFTPQQEALRKIEDVRAQQLLKKQALKARFLPKKLTTEHLLVQKQYLKKQPLIISLLAELNKTIMLRAIESSPEGRVVLTEYAKCVLHGEATRQILMRTKGDLSTRAIAAVEYAFNSRINLLSRVNKLGAITGLKKVHTTLAPNDLNISLYGLEEWLNNLLTVDNNTDETIHLIHSHQFIYGASEYLKLYWKAESYH